MKRKKRHSYHKTKKNNGRDEKMKRDRQCVYNCSYQRLLSDKKKTSKDKDLSYWKN